MSADRSQKNFDATPSRKDKAKRDGNVARSSEASGIAAFACAALATFATLPWLAQTTAGALGELSARPDLTRVPGNVWAVPAIALIPAGAAALGGLGANLAQAGGLRANMPKLQLSRLNPVAGLKRMLGAEAAVGAARALVAFGIAALALWPLGVEIFARSTTLADPGAFGVLFVAAAQRACFATVATGACFAIADYAMVRRRWLRDLKMSLEEIRRDQKENDGDPHTRSRRKTLHRTLVRGSIARTKEASFVVVNPTHIAIAVRYAPPDVPVPEILVRAADEAARSVKALAAAHGIPIVENVTLARALYATGEAGAAIPSATFVAVARVIAELVRAGAIT
jgi:flagellar biosynthesis protein FlhB